MNAEERFQSDKRYHDLSRRIGELEEQNKALAIHDRLNEIEAVYDAIQPRVETLEKEIERIQAIAATLDEWLEARITRLETVSEDLKTTTADALELVHGALEKVTAITDDLEGRVDSLASSVESLRGRVARGENATQLAGGDLEDKVLRLESKLDDLSDDVEKLQRGY